jgi:hypothetical protein
MYQLRYGVEWPGDWDDAQVERMLLQHGGYYRGFGRGLFEHYKNYWTLLWPEDAQTKWTDLILKEIIGHQFVSVIGGGSSWKTGTIARVALMDWSLFPECTYIIVSSTEMEGLRARIFGEISKLWSRAKDLYDWFPGHLVDYKIAITNENVEDDKIRDMRNAIIGVPCKSSQGRFVGIGRYLGRKNRRVWSIGDEFQFMERSILDAQENLISNGPNLVPGYYPEDYMEPSERGKPLRVYRGVFIGNPNPTRPENPLHLVSEPQGGWSSVLNDGRRTGCATYANSARCRVINPDSIHQTTSIPTENRAGRIWFTPHASIFTLRNRKVIGRRASALSCLGWLDSRSSPRNCATSSMHSICLCGERTSNRPR